MPNHIEEILKLLSSKEYSPITETDIKRRLGIKKHQKKEFYKDLKKLRRQGRIKKVAKDRYVISSKPKPSRFIFGTLRRIGSSYFIKNSKGEYRLNRLINPFHALAGDEVAVKTEKRRIGYVTRIVKVISRKYKNVIGYLRRYSKGWILEPIDRKIDFNVAVKDGDNTDFKENYVALCELTEYPAAGKKASGRIVKIYGDKFDNTIDEAVVIDKYNLPHIFSEDVQNELKQINSLHKKEFEGREDFRHLHTITIDGADAKDFDDAVDIEKTKNGFRLYVHIADVSHYVKPHNAIDKEAFRRGFSVYFPGSVIPMIPHKLSNDICSLVPHEDRLSVSAVMDIDLKGNIKKYRFVRSVIQNKNRMTYRGVQAILDNRAECEDELKGRLEYMRQLAAILRKKRFKKGSIDLDIPEAEFIIENGEIVNIEERPRWFSHFIIEEFMLAANLCSADIMSKHFDTFIRRVHDDPDVKKIYVLSDFLKKFGIKYSFNKDSITSRDIQKLLESIKDEQKKKIVSYFVLRSLKRAEYSIENKRHFALGFDNYTHFTSPIRRYPDLVVHRMIKSIIGGDRYPFEDLGFIVSGIQERETATEEAEFYMDDIKCASFMASRVGERYSGTIVSMIPSGIFVRLDRYFVDGFISVNRMKDDYYEYYEEIFSMIGKRNKKVYRIGDRVEVTVVSVNKFAGEVDFIFV